MIARHDAPSTPDKPNLWIALAAPLDADAVSWRQDGAPVAREGSWYARFVAHPGPNAVRERLDRVVPGEWDLTLELLPALPAPPGATTECAFKARLQILGVIREDVGTGPDYKAAANDALARAAVRFGIGHELSEREPNWIAVEPQDAAHPIEAPATADARRSESGASRRATTSSRTGATPAVEVAPLQDDADVATESVSPVGDDPSCPKCSGRMWDNRLTKRNPKAPDFKCRDRSCDGVIWPPRPGEASEPAPAATTPSRPAVRGSSRSRGSTTSDTEGLDTAPLGASRGSSIDDDDLPF